MPDQCAVLNRKDPATRIHSLLDWCKHAPPASRSHWVPGASALELARDWVEGRAEERLRSFLSGRAATFEGLRLSKAIAEAQTGFDRFGGWRNHDILAYGSAAAGPVVISIEGKVNESFGQSLAAYRKATSKTSNKPARLDALTLAIAGATIADDPSLAKLRFQLFSAVAGTLGAASEPGAHAVMIVQTFATPRLTRSAKERNAAALTAFVRRVWGDGMAERTTGEQWLIGPLKLAAKASMDREPPEWAARPLWLGHLLTAPPEFALPREQWDCKAMSEGAS